MPSLNADTVERIRRGLKEHPLNNNAEVTGLGLTTMTYDVGNGTEGVGGEGGESESKGKKVLNNIKKAFMKEIEKIPRKYFQYVFCCNRKFH